MRPSIAPGVIVLLALGFPPAVRAQAVSAERISIPRPALPEGADTNSAAAYFDFGTARLQRNPMEAANAFYWAARLNPENAEYPYGRRVALLMTDPTRLVRYMEYDYRTLVSPEIRAIDSLALRAYMMDPFLHPRLEAPLFMEYVQRAVRLGLGSAAGAFDATELTLLVEQLARDHPGDAALLAYANRRFPEALRHWADVARRNRRNPWVRAQRARAFAQIGSFDSARVQMQEALTIARRRDADSISFFYESKAQWQYSLGRILEQLGREQEARDAFEQTLTEDLSYYPAHLRLGVLAIGRGDTAAALREFGRAVAVKEDEYLPRATYGYFLANGGQLDSALVHLRRAAEIEPHAAQPRMMIGAVLDARGDAPGALAAFEAYLARAGRNDPDLHPVRARVDALRAARR